MKQKKLTEKAMLVLVAASFISLANCGKRLDYNEGEAFSINGSDGADLAVANGPLTAYARSTAYGLANIDVYIETNCHNGRDDNGNGVIDCADPDCQIHPECSEFGPPFGDLTNTRAVTIYPNGILAPEDVVILEPRGVDDDNFYGWQRNGYFADERTDCWVSPREHDPYFGIPLGEGLVDGPLGPVGPLLDPASVVGFFGPRAGDYINECGFGADLMFHHTDDDNGSGAGASSDSDDDEGGSSDDGKFNG